MNVWRGARGGLQPLRVDLQVTMWHPIDSVLESALTIFECVCSCGATRGGPIEFHGKELVKLVFNTPQAITGVEMYTEGASRALHYTLLLYLYFIVAHRETDAFRPAGTRPTTRASALMPP